jgi:hypothetical protein
MHRLCIALLLLISTSLLFFGEAKAGPKAVFPESDHDFRSIKEGDKVTHNFRIINGGNEPLEITRVAPDCGCTAAFLSKETLLPGEEGEIKTVFDSSNRPGEFEKKIRVVTNDPETPTTTLEIRGTVESGPSPAIEVTNRKIDFGVISLKSPHEFAISIRNTGKEDLIVSSIKNPRGEAFLSSEVTIPSESRKILHLAYNPQKKGPINESMTIYSNDPSRPRFYFFLSGYVEQEEKITLIRKTRQSFVILNNTSEHITVLPGDSMETKQQIGPYQKTAIDLGAAKEGESELVISLGFNKAGE